MTTRQTNRTLRPNSNPRGPAPSAAAAAPTASAATRKATPPATAIAPASSTMRPISRSNEADQGPNRMARISSDEAARLKSPADPSKRNGSPAKTLVNRPGTSGASNPFALGQAAPANSTLRKSNSPAPPLRPSTNATMRGTSTIVVSSEDKKETKSNDTQTIQALLTRIQSGTHEDKKLAARAFAHFACSNESFFDLGGHVHLVEMCKSTDADIQYCALFAISTLSPKSESNKLKLVQASVVKNLLDMLPRVTASNNRTLNLSSINALATLDEVKLRVLESGGIESILKIMSTGTEEEYFYCLGCLTTLCLHDQVKDRLAMSGLTQIVESLTAPNPEAHKLGAFIVSHLAMKVDLQPKLIDGGILPPLLNIIKTEVNPNKIQALTCITNLAAMNETNQKKMIQSGVLDALSSIVSVEDEQLQIRILAVICNLATSGENRIKISDAGLIDLLIRNLKSESIEIQFRSCVAIANLAQEETGIIKEVLAQKGALPPLVNNLYSQSADVIAMAANALGGICISHAQNIELLVKSGVMEPLSRLTSCNTEQILRHVSRLLAAIAINEPTQMYFFGHQLPEGCLAMGKFPNKEIAQCAIATIAHLTQHDEIRAKLIREGGVRIFVEILGLPILEEDRDTCLYAIWGFANIAADEIGKANLNQQGVVQKLKQFKNNGDLLVNCEAARALTNLDLDENEEDEEWQNETQDLGQHAVPFSEIVFGDRIGMGGFGEVYKGTFRGSIVAIKKLLKQDMDKQDLNDFVDEVRLMSKLSHPNILKFMGACMERKNLCLLTEFMEKGSLYHLLRKEEEQFSMKKIVDMCIETAKGISYLHSFKPPVIHRDLKTENLLVDRDYHIKIADFGISRVKSVSCAMTQCGTPKYMAPEVLKNDKYDEKADVYSFGMVMWEMLSREEPYADMHPVVAGMKIAYKGLRPNIPDGANPEFVSLIKVCWETASTKRPPFTEIITRLSALAKTIR